MAVPVDITAAKQIGAGLATTLANLQVVLVAIAAWALLGERPSARVVLCVPLVFAGAVLISGVIGEGAYGDNPALGALYGVLTAVAYTGFILVLREGSRDLRRPAGPLFSATLVATLVAIAAAYPVADEARRARLLELARSAVTSIERLLTEPELERPFRVQGNIRIRGVDVPVAALVGAPLTFAIWVVSLVTHDATRIAGPLWLLLGAVVYVGTRWSRGQAIFGRVVPAEPDLVPAEEGVYERILVPMKLGIIGEEMAATAVKLASEHGAAVEALHVIEVPLDRELEAEMIDKEENAAASLAEACLLGEELGVEVLQTTIRARSIGSAIVERAQETGADPGPYDECGPVFVHAEDCGGPTFGPGYPVRLHGPRRVLRAYDARGHILGGHLVELPRERAEEMDRPLREAFADPAVAVVHVRAVEFGCFLAEVRRR